MTLVDQWAQIAVDLPADWEEVQLTVTAESEAGLMRAAQVLCPLHLCRYGDLLVVHVRRAGGASSPEAARRLFRRLDAERVWCLLSPGEVRLLGETERADDAPEHEPVAAQWDATLATLPGDWSDMLGELEIVSSDLLPRAALLCAPINPTRDRGTTGFVFRCARRTGYGVSPAMARRCFERLDAEGIPGRVGVRRVLSDTRNVATQGAVWLVGGHVL